MIILLRPSRLLAALVVGVAALGACGSSPRVNPDGNDGVTMSCDDGTGRANCCQPTVISGASCPASTAAECWTRCSSGFTGHFECSGDGSWLAGLGLFPCGADAGSGG
jgi:hypothetical protein